MIGVHRAQVLDHTWGSSRQGCHPRGDREVRRLDRGGVLRYGYPTGEVHSSRGTPFLFVPFWVCANLNLADRAIKCIKQARGSIPPPVRWFCAPLAGPLQPPGSWWVHHSLSTGSPGFRAVLETQGVSPPYLFPSLFYPCHLVSHSFYLFLALNGYPKAVSRRTIFRSFYERRPTNSLTFTFLSLSLPPPPPPPPPLPPPSLSLSLPLLYPSPSPFFFFFFFTYCNCRRWSFSIKHG